MAPKPSVKAILICDQIIHEQGTNKKSLIGIFEDIHLLQFPANYPRIGVYVNLTDAHGKYVLEVRLVSPDGNHIGPVRTPEVEIDSPLRTCEFALQAQNIPFRVPGKYDVQIFANDEFLASKTFSVKKAQFAGNVPPDVFGSS